MSNGQYPTIEKTIDDKFELSRKHDEYFPIYIRARDKSFEKYIFEIDYSSEILDLENAIRPFEGEIPSSNIVINFLNCSLYIYKPLIRTDI